VKTDKFKKWFYSSNGIPLKLNKKDRIIGFVNIVVLYCMVVIFGFTLLVFQNCLLALVLSYFVCVSISINSFLITRDLAKQIKEQMGKEQER